jgi:dTDP-4-amino-4,6-dideoxygalactose transaminase
VIEEKLVEHERKTAGRSYGGNELRYVEEALKSGKLSGLNGGTFTGRFEAEFARLLGAGHAVAMNSCMSALHAALICAGAFAGSEVVCDSEFVFGALAALYNNAIPVFVDIDPVTHNMDPEKLESAISERTKAVIVTHAWGLPAEIDRIVDIAHRRNVMVIEDCAESLLADYRGRYTGTWGDIGCFSFQASKQLSLGDGGMATTGREDIWKKLANHAGAPTFQSVAYSMDFNYRVNEPTAAVGLAQLETMPGLVAQLRRNARFFDQAVEGCRWIRLQRGPEAARHSFYHWAATVADDSPGPDFNEFKRSVEAAGFSTLSIGYTGMPAYRHPVIAQRRAHAFHCVENRELVPAYGPGMCPTAEKVIPRLLLAYVIVPEETAEREAEKLHRLVRQLEGK